MTTGFASYNVGLISKATLFSASQKEQLSLIAQACNQQLNQHWNVAWGRKPAQFVYRPDGTIPDGWLSMALIDDDGQAGALGYHDEQGDTPDGIIEVKTILAAGAGMLDAGTSGSSGNSPFSLLSVISHEAMEMAGDPSINYWVQSADGTLHAFEMCDAVQSGMYVIPIGGVNCYVSNFLTPAWFDQQNTNATATNYMGQSIQSFTISPGGYEIYMTGAGQPQQKFGEKINPVIKKLKENSFRFHSRPGMKYAKLRHSHHNRLWSPPIPEVWTHYIPTEEKPLVGVKKDPFVPGLKSKPVLKSALKELPESDLLHAGDEVKLTKTKSVESDDPKIDVTDTEAETGSGEESEKK
jgi:hypothetical protein